VTEPFERWEIPARVAMSDRGIGYHVANPIIAEVKAHCAYTGQSPQDAFGSPQEFAAVTAAEQPPEMLRKVDQHGVTPMGYLTGSVFGLALAVLVVAIFFSILNRSLTFAVTPATLTGMVFVGLAKIAAAGVPGALRSAGRPTLAPWGYALAGLLGALGVLSFATLPHTRLARIPTLGIVGVAIIVLWGLTQPDRAPRSAGNQKLPTPRTTVVGPDGVEGWLSRLAGLLIGRYDLPHERAVDLVSQARAHLSAAGTAPEDEFGPVDQYAKDLAEHEALRQGPWWRGTAAQTLGTAAGISLAVDAFLSWHDVHPWAAYLMAAPATVFGAWGLVQLTRRYLRERQAGPASE
jgi:hypothetical protein